MTHSDWETGLHTGPTAVPNPHYDCGTIYSPPCPTGQCVVNVATAEVRLTDETTELPILDLDHARGCLDRLHQPDSDPDGECRYTGPCENLGDGWWLICLPTRLQDGLDAGTLETVTVRGEFRLTAGHPLDRAPRAHIQVSLDYHGVGPIVEQEEAEAALSALLDDDYSVCRPLAPGVWEVDLPTDLTEELEREGTIGLRGDGYALDAELIPDEGYPNR